MTTNLKPIIHSFQHLAAFNSAVAEYLTGVDQGMSAEGLQKLWHQGFESFGPEFADVLASLPNLPY